MGTVEINDFFLDAQNQLFFLDIKIQFLYFLLPFVLFNIHFRKAIDPKDCDLLIYPFHKSYHAVM